MKVKVTLAAVIVIMASGSSLAADWPQWQGPDRDGKSADTGLLKQWPQEGSPLAWKIDKLGGGDSVACLQAEDGKIVWHNRKPRVGTFLECVMSKPGATTIHRREEWDATLYCLLECADGL